MPTLYRKYRPQVFADITGQEHIIQTLENEISTDKVTHSYLFSGPRGTGKTTIARLLAKAINCQNRTMDQFEPCNECSSCKEISESRNIDVIEIDAASHTGVDNVRENIVENAQFKPTKSKFKVFIIDEVHMLSTSSFNALLKTIEEPPAHVIFILATTEIHKILPTIISRCQRFTFQRIPFDQMMMRLEMVCQKENIKVEKAVLERIINKSDGCLRDAESLLGQILSLNLKEIKTADAELVLPSVDSITVINYIEKTLNNSPAEAIMIVNTAINDGANLDQFAHNLIEALRTIMITQSGQNLTNTDYNQETIKKLKKLADNIPTDKIIRFIDKALVRKQEIKSAPIPQLPLELLAVEMGGAGNNGSDYHNEKVKESDNKESFPEKTPLGRPLKMTDEGLTEKKTIASSIKSAFSAITHPHHEIKIPLEEIKPKWDEVIKKLDASNHSLTFVLKLCELSSTANGLLNISVPYSFHKEKIEDKKNKKTIEDCLTQLCGEKIWLSCTVKEDAPQTETIDNQTINNVAADFGGKVVSN
ncbi:MAG: DNA polymerase III subunit gamma/tau [Candidatus Magasanikbacteria bacterium]